MRFNAISLTLLALASCQPVIWTRPNTSLDEAKRDSAKCQLTANAATQGTYGLINRSYERAEDFGLCMQALGYTATKAAAVSAPAPTAAPLQPIAPSPPPVATSTPASTTLGATSCPASGSFGRSMAGSARIHDPQGEEVHPGRGVSGG